MNVFGKSPMDQPVPEISPPWENVEGGGGATRYARPCRPVKPLLMIEDVGMRSVRHFWQRRWAVDRSGRKNDGCGGEEDGEMVDVVDVLMAELRRLRNGTVGRRYKGKKVVGELGMIVKISYGIKGGSEDLSLRSK